MLPCDLPFKSPLFCHCGYWNDERVLSICQHCGKYLYSRWYLYVENRFAKVNRKRCPECRNRLMIDTAPKVEMWFHCNKCKIFLSPTFGVVASENYVLKNRRKEVIDPVPFPQEMIKRNNLLKERDKPGIVVDAEFHKYFCKVMKDESGRDCKCYGEDLPKE